MVAIDVVEELLVLPSGLPLPLVLSRSGLNEESNDLSGILLTLRSDLIPYIPR
jgi:hypothetical protein